VNDDAERLADQLDAINDEIGDLVMAALRKAVADGETSRPDIEKRLTRARRSIEKASHLLRGKV
jgi:hypothetical protein